MKHDMRCAKNYRYTGSFAPRVQKGTEDVKPDDAPSIVAEETDRNLLDEIQALLQKLGAAKIYLTFYLIEFGGLPKRLAKPLLAEAAGRCAMLRLPSKDHHLVIYLGPEPSQDTSGFLGWLRRSLAAVGPLLQPDQAWAEARMLRRCNHDITAPTHLLLDLNATAPRVLGLTNW